MHKSDSHLNEPTKDKLEVFVSSRLQECSAERKAARKAIQSINHNPVLFEHLGARSIEPRILYLSRLRDSQIMIAIYRDGYGFINEQGGMEISGLEDEYQFAKKHGIPILLYVFADNSKRDQRLKTLIESASINLTMSFYHTAEELEEKIRDDVTAEITRSVVRPEVARGVAENSSGYILQRAEKRQGKLLSRPQALEALKAASEKSAILCVYGEAGTGKTTLTAQFAESEVAAYVRVNGLAPLDLFTVCAEAVSEPSVNISFLTLQGAILGFAAAWADASEIILVVDECEFIAELLKAVEQGGGVSPKKRIIVTAREPIAGVAAFCVPDLEVSEVSEMLSGKAVILAQKTVRTPLEVQAILYRQEDQDASTSPLARELLSYLALSLVPLAADELLGRVDEFDQAYCGRDADDRAIVALGFLAAEGDALEAFEFAEALFDAPS